MVLQAQQKPGQSVAGNLENVEEVSLLEYLHSSAGQDTLVSDIPGNCEHIQTPGVQAGKLQLENY